ncbi:MAG TPA: hypothetical protein ENI07_13050 [Desulfobacterales bacterium]|nr:hypothetical protein [Desulfobacterales bacterium]
MKRKYTEKIHAQRLLKMLKKKEPCGCCPAQPGYKANTWSLFDRNNTGWHESVDDICRTRLHFVGLRGGKTV